MNGKTALLPCLLFASATWAHDPIFGLGPHVLYKGGVEAAADWHGSQGVARTDGYGLELTYGLTGDWAIGMETPLGSDAGSENLDWFSKYRFWRKDSLGVQQSAALMLRRDGDTYNPAWAAGLAWGYESRRHYRWASLRYRNSDSTAQGLEPGDGWKLDLVAGYRPWLTGYLQPDSVFMLELNGEQEQQSRLNGRTLANTGGTRWFLSPGIFWTLRNVAVKAGIQIPVSQKMNNPRQELDYRTSITLEWHL